MAVDKDDLSSVLATLDVLHTRMDSLEVGSGSKNPIKCDEEDKMAEKTKNDGEKEEEVKEDAEEEEKEKEEGEDEKKADDEGEQEQEKKAPPVAADKKRKDQVSAPSSSATAKAPVVKKDEEEEDKKADGFEKTSADDGGDKRRDAAIADAAEQNRSLERKLAEQAKEMQAQAASIARLTAMIKPRSDDEHAAFADAQARADAVFEGFGKQAPRSLEGESFLNYRKRLATALKPYSATWKTVKFSALPEEAFVIAENQVYADAAHAATTACDVGEGELREVIRTNPRTGQKTTVFYGRDSFVKAMGQPARRVGKINTQFGSGRQ